jgi:hypothetical protein
MTDHLCHETCSCESQLAVEEVIAVATPLPPVVIWCTKCGGPKPCSCSD